MMEIHIHIHINKYNKSILENYLEKKSKYMYIYSLKSMYFCEFISIRSF